MLDGSKERWHGWKNLMLLWVAQNPIYSHRDGNFQWLLNGASPLRFHTLKMDNVIRGGEIPIHFFNIHTATLPDMQMWYAQEVFMVRAVPHCCRFDRVRAKCMMHTLFLSAAFTSDLLYDQSREFSFRASAVIYTWLFNWIPGFV